MAARSGSSEAQNAMTAISNLIWTTDEICEEQKFVKRPWYFRDCRMMSKAASDWPSPILWVQVKKTERITLSFGPVIAVAACDFKKGHGKDKAVARGLNFLTMSGPKGFTAVVVDLDLYDVSSLETFEEDPVVKEVASTMEMGIFNCPWVTKFVDDSEELMLPIVQGEYKARVGQEFRPIRKLNVRRPTPSGSELDGPSSSRHKKKSKVSEGNPSVRPDPEDQATPSTPGGTLGSQARTGQVSEKGVSSVQGLPVTILSKKKRSDRSGASAGATSGEAVSMPGAARGSDSQVLRSTPVQTDNEDEDGETALASYETDSIKAELAKLMLERRVQRTSVLLHIQNLILEDEGENSTLVRPVDQLHVENIKMLLTKNPSNFSAPFVVVVDPEDCPTPADWDISKARLWRYRVIGGNHGARAKSDLFKMYKKQVYAEVEAWVYAGLSKHEVRMLAFQHNYDQEYRKTMSDVDIIRACHKIFLEMNVGSNKDVREACCKECMLHYIPGVRDSMAKHDPKFQVAFRTGEVWDLTEKIFSMWQKLETLGQPKPIVPKLISSGKGKGKRAKLTATETKFNKLCGVLNIRHFRALQGLSNEDHVKRLLNRVIGKKISLEQMYKEGETLKKLAKVKNLFVQIAGQKDWPTCREMFPEETQVKVLTAWCEKLGDALKVTSKKKNKELSGNEFSEGVKVEIPAGDVPYVFKNFVLEAIDKYNRRQNLQNVESSEHHWKNANGDIFSYCLHVGDVRESDKFLEPKHYTLAVADIPYGFNVAGSEFDEEAFKEKEVLEMISKFAKVTTAKLWRFVVIHSLQQTNMVMSALEKVCNCGVEAGIWEKTNINQFPSGPRLAWAFENWSIGYYSEEGVRRKDMYNFLPDDSRINIVKVPCVTQKSIGPLGFIVNPYQKPVALGDWFVNHFSDKGDWVADLCCGTGSTLVAALLNSRHGCAVDRGSTQIDFVKNRIITLDSEWTLFDEALCDGEGDQGLEVQPPVCGELGHIGTTIYVDQKEESGDDKPEDQDEQPKSPDDAELEELFAD